MIKVAILGAGLVGRLLSLTLDKINASDADALQITLIEQGKLAQPQGPGLIAAAMVSPTAESVVASEHIVAMGSASLNLWPKLLDYNKLDVVFQQAGSLVLAHQQDIAHLSSFVQRIKTSKPDAIERIDRTKMQALEPELSRRFSSGYFIPDEAQVDNQGLYRETERAIEQSQIKLLTQSLVTSTVYQHEQGKVEVSCPDGESLTDHHLEFDWVIDCRGLGAKQDLVAKSDALRGVRGEVIRVRAPEVDITRPIRLMHPRYPIYCVPKPDNEFVIGATEIESQDDKPITVRSALELLSAAYSLHTGFAEAEVLSMNAGLRPTRQDNEPKVSVKDALIQINGLYRHGYLLTPYLVNQALNLLEAETGLALNFSQVEQTDSQLIDSF
ncbi:FAD-dependent oxidoreductase [Catenovulum sp. SM1970]|uniref:FAD-dependent oxidoreductase n=1 Tax=Marinifaba aquimaris TaxID=2741323 RepID=UPI0015727E6B|nr:FAD-dependent oxidoreductase [Marinifaba aquimaris]NTS77135.1 FAD-dependent oxidoreductase [Marinifaba aquimaris]